MASMSEWILEPDDVAALWYSEAIDRFPPPLEFLSRFEYLEEYRAHRATLESRFPDDALRAIREALAVVAGSTRRIEIVGGPAPESAVDRGGYRVLGACDGSRAALLTQGIGALRGRIAVRTCRPDDLPTLLAAAIHSSVEPAPSSHRSEPGGGAAGLRLGPIYRRSEAVDMVEWHASADDDPDPGRSISTAELGARFTAWLDTGG